MKLVRQYLTLIADQITLQELHEFDAQFYARRYGDLASLRSSRELKLHYLRHGRCEGRAKNERQAKVMLETRYGRLPDDFDIGIYRLLNTDLARALSQDIEFVEHYLAHGRNEGRLYKSNELIHDPVIDPDGLLFSIFRPVDFLAMNRDWLVEYNIDKAELYSIFINHGIARIAPFNVAYIFDPIYYKKKYKLHHLNTDEDLYRHWLISGLRENMFPNEESDLRRFLPTGNFPTCFDVDTFVRDLPTKQLSSIRTRADAIEAYFEFGFERSGGGYIEGDGAFGLLTSLCDYFVVRGRFAAARKAARCALAIRSNDSRALNRLGDAERALGNLDAAIEAFVAGASSEQSPQWNFVNAAKLLAERRDFESAFKVLHDFRRRWEKSELFRATVSEVVENYFATNAGECFELYKGSTDRSVIDRRMELHLERIHEVIVDLLPTPAVLPCASEGHVVILGSHDLPQCRYYRIEQKVQQFDALGIPTKVFRPEQVDEFMSAVVGARAAIFYRVPAFPSIISAIHTARSLGVITYYEIDDLIFDYDHYPDEFTSFEGQITENDYAGLKYGVPLFRFAMKLCDRAIASTSVLGSFMEAFVREKSVTVLPNGLDRRNDEIMRRNRGSIKSGDCFNIFYGSGTKSHNRDFNALAGAALVTIFDRFPNVRLIVVGNLELSPALARFSERITKIPFVADVHEYWSLLAACDLNIAVLSPGLMADCKSEIKWLEAAMLGVASAVSATATYEAVLADGEDAILIKDCVSAWEQAFERLIVNEKDRVAIARRAKAKAVKLYSLNTTSAILKREFSPEHVAVKQSGKIRILLVNVFFPPQTYGGATRVVKENVDWLIDNCPDLDLFVLASDEGVGVPHKVRHDTYRGIPVTRISAPNLNNWLYEDEGNGAFFGQLLDAIQPDVVHFHCIQRLTGRIVDATAARNIPYVITVHDGWWISDFQFLADDDGTTRLPTVDPFLAMTPENVSRSQSIARRLRTLAWLKGADKVLAVSPTFAELYQAVGCDNVISVANGASVIKNMGPTALRGGKLVLGHLGGRASPHKGASLVEGILRSSQFENLQLRMVDERLEYGVSEHQRWGLTDVELCGYYPQADIMEFYQSIDVLLVPSLCMESFGLVVVEAHSAGVLVIASDRGALSENIEEGVDGYVVNVDGPSPLCAILSEMNAKTQNYRRKPSPFRVDVRTSADQSREIANIYEQIVGK